MRSTETAGLHLRPDKTPTGGTPTVLRLAQGKLLEQVTVQIEVDASTARAEFALARVPDSVTQRRAAPATSASP